MLDLVILKEEFSDFNFHYVSITGSALYIMSKDGSSFCQCTWVSDSFWIELISVNESNRKNGIGRLLLDLSHKIALQCGFNECNLLCDKESFVYDWYVRAGYVDEEMFGDEYPTWIYMKKNFSSDVY